MITTTPVDERQKELAGAIHYHGRVIEKVPERGASNRTASDHLLRLREFEPIELEVGHQQWELFDECTLHGLRFVVFSCVKKMAGYSGNRPWFKWSYTIKVFDAGEIA